MIHIQYVLEHISWVLRRLILLNHLLLFLPELLNHFLHVLDLPCQSWNSVQILLQVQQIQLKPVRNSEYVPQKIDQIRLNLLSQSDLIRSQLLLIHEILVLILQSGQFILQVRHQQSLIVEFLGQRLPYMSCLIVAFWF